MITNDTKEKCFLRSTPWILDAHPQSPDPLTSALRYESSRFKELPHQPRFSLLTVLRDTRPLHLSQLILSVRCQSYQNWELLLIDDGSNSCKHLPIARRWVDRDRRISLKCLERPVGPSRARNLAVKESTGDYLIVTDGDGVLHPMALGVFARHINDNPKVNFVHANEAEIDADSIGLTNFFLKPPFDLFTLLRLPYVGRLYAVGRDLLNQATNGGPVFRAQYDGLEEHDLLLRLALTGAVEPRNDHLFTYYRRGGSEGLARLTNEELVARRRRLAEEFVPRAYPGFTWSSKVTRDRDPLAPTSIWLNDLPGSQRPRLLIVIPFKDEVETTIQCLDSIEQQEHRLDVLVALVNNRSKDEKTIARLSAWMNWPRTSKYELLNQDCAFSFAKLNNTAIARLGGDRDLILLLNNDVELSIPQTLQTMAMQLLADRTIGFIGIKLFYPGGEEIQHGGIRIGEYICGSGFNQVIHGQSSSEFVDAERISLGVTFACAMTRRETFEKLGGLEEIYLPTAFGDVDMCLRAIEAGYRNHYMGTLSAIHHESKSRGRADEDIEFNFLYERCGRTIASWRHWHLNRSYRYAWPLQVYAWNYSPALPEQDNSLVTASVPHTSRAERVVATTLPLRYRVADRINVALKRGLGPIHGMVRHGIAHADWGYRAARQPGAVLKLGRRLLGPIPVIGNVARSGVREARRMRRRWQVSMALLKSLSRDRESAGLLAMSLRRGGLRGFRKSLQILVPAISAAPQCLQESFERTRPSGVLLARMRRRRWPASAPKFTVITPVYNVREDWLREAVGSVTAQTYPRWEMICVNDHSTAPHIRPVLDELSARDSRVRVIHCETNCGVAVATNRGIAEATGDYVALMDHDDFLEPHALHRFAEAILHNQPDMIYSDEAITGETLDNIRRVDARPAFSYDQYLGHPYFVHLIATRTELVRKVGGLNEEMSISQDVDLNLRLIEVCQTICHVPEVLYRWRTHPTSLGHQKNDDCRTMTRGALERHFARTGQLVRFDDEAYFNFRDLSFQHQPRARVAILIPSTNGSELLRACIRSLEQTIDRSLAEIIVIDHQPRIADSLGDLADVRKRHRVITHRGSSNFSAVINTAVDSVRGPYTHYLLLGDEIEAIDPGWLEHMLGYGQRPDVGVVGALLIDATDRVRHAGLVIGLNGLADTAYKDVPYRGYLSGQYLGQEGSLLASRDVSAVSAACMLTRSDLFHRLSGFDERLGSVLNDVDYCLRTSALGYKIIQDAYAILLHSRAEARKADVDGRCSKDARLFFERYHELICKGDPFYSPLRSRFTTFFPFDHLATRDRIHLPRTTRVVLPAPTTTGRSTRFDAHRSEQPGRRPHYLGLSDASRRMTYP